MQFLKAFLTVLVAITVTVSAVPLNPQPLPPGVAHVDPDHADSCTLSTERANV